jgi:hypothetical protein
MVFACKIAISDAGHPREPALKGIQERFFAARSIVSGEMKRSGSNLRGRLGEICVLRGDM